MLLIEQLAFLNTNKLFAGITLIIMNFGSRFVIGDMTAAHEAIISSPGFKKIVLFCMFFVGTRDIITSAMLAFAFSIVVDVLLNEKRRFNLVPSFIVKKASLSSEAKYLEALNFVRLYEETKKREKIETDAESKAAAYIKAMKLGVGNTKTSHAKTSHAT